MASDDKRIKYSDSPFAPDWAKAPEKRGDVITSFGKPIPEAEDNPHLDFGNQKNSFSKAKIDEVADQPFKPTVEQIEEILWQDANDDIGVYCIMDGYWAEGLYGRLLTSDDISWAHMFQGDVATRNIQQAPFIIALKRGHKLTKWLIEEGWGHGWGIYFTASTHKAHLLYGNPRINDKRFLPSNEEQLKLGNLTKGPEDPLWKMRRHFRQFSDVYLESENKIVDFRYYDPWVNYIYLKIEVEAGSCTMLKGVYQIMSEYQIFYNDYKSNNKIVIWTTSNNSIKLNIITTNKILLKTIKFGISNFLLKKSSLFKINKAVIDEYNNNFLCSFCNEASKIILPKLKEYNYKRIEYINIDVLDAAKKALSIGLRKRIDIFNFIICFLLIDFISSDRRRIFENITKQENIEFKIPNIVKFLSELSNSI